MDPTVLLERLDAEERVFREELYPAYREQLQAQSAREAATRAASAVPIAAAAAPAPGSVGGSAGGGGGAGGLTASALLKMAVSLREGDATATRAIPEMSNDPTLFRIPLLSAPWDSARGPGGGPPDAFFGRLPSFSVGDPTRGSNTLLIRGEIDTNPRSFLAVFIGRVPEGQTAAAALASDVFAHVTMRVDPPRAASAAGSWRYLFRQSFKRQGRWDNALARTTQFTAETWPLTPGKPFWLRMVLDRRGCFVYLDGRPISFTLHPPGEMPEEGEALYLQLPIAGDSGEKPNWKATGIWWGYCPVGPEAEPLAAAAGAAAAPAVVLSADTLYVTGLRPGTTPEVLAGAMAAFRPAEVRMGTAPGSAVVRLADAAAATSALSAAVSRSIQVNGAVIAAQRAAVSAR